MYVVYATMFMFIMLYNNVRRPQVKHSETDSVLVGCLIFVLILFVLFCLMGRLLKLCRTDDLCAFY